MRRESSRAREEEEKEDHDQSNRILYELCSLIIHILRSPPFLGFLSLPTLPPSSSSSPFPSSSSLSAFVALLFGMSMAMMLFGSIIFLIGLLLLPWVVGLVGLFYLAQISYNLSELLRRNLLFCPASCCFGCFPREWEI